jgi:peroxiredoxin-like protein
MKPLPHIYRVHLAGGPGTYAALSDSGLPELRTAPPADFDGPGDAWSPEQLLLAAVESCFLFTFQAIARASKLLFTSLEVAGEGIVDRKDGVIRFSGIVLRPTLRLAAANDRERAMRILEKSEQACLVSASLSTPVRLEPEIVIG